jgi:hypothetical protein
MAMSLYRKYLATALAVALLLQLAGCSAFRPLNQTVQIDCAQPGVQLQVNGAPHACPAAVPVRRNRAVDVRASREGFPTQQRLVKFQISTTGILDLAGGLIILVPAIGLAFPGAFDLDTTSLYFDLRQPAPALAEK